MTACGFTAADLRSLPNLSDAFCEADGALPWAGVKGLRELLLAGERAIADGARRVLHLGCRDGQVTVALATALRAHAGSDAVLLAADSWISSAADWTREWPPALRRMPAADRLRRSFLDLLVRGGAADAVLPLVADGTAVHALCQSRDLRFDLIVASMHLSDLPRRQIVADIALLGALLAGRGLLVASIASERGLDRALAEQMKPGLATVRSGAVLAFGRGGLPAWLGPKRAALPPLKVARVPTATALQHAQREAVPLEQVSPGFCGVVEADRTVTDPPRIVLARDRSGTFDAPLFFAPHKEQSLDYIVQPDGVWGVQPEFNTAFVPNMSMADAAGRPFVDEPGDRATAYHDRLFTRGLIDHDARGTTLVVPGPVQRVSGTVFGTAAFDRYFHWHNDVLAHLPYVFDLQRALGSGPVRILSTWPLTDWRLRTLELMGLDADSYVEVRPGRPVRVDGTLVAVRRPGMMTPRRARDAYARMQATLGIPAEGSDRLYISRADAGIREVENEAELRPHLEALGFRIVALGAMSYDDKVRLFSRASVCIGPHGAGFSHIGFMRKESLVVEMLTAGAKWMRRGFIARMAAVFNQDYGFVCYPEAAEPKLNFRVDPTQFVADLAPLLEDHATSGAVRR